MVICYKALDHSLATSKTPHLLCKHRVWRTLARLHSSGRLLSLSWFGDGWSDSTSCSFSSCQWRSKWRRGHPFMRSRVSISPFLLLAPLSSSGPRWIKTEQNRIEQNISLSRATEALLQQAENWIGSKVCRFALQADPASLGVGR